jgi:hypothetical protein
MMAGVTASLALMPGCASTVADGTAQAAPVEAHGPGGADGGARFVSCPAASGAVYHLGGPGVQRVEHAVIDGSCNSVFVGYAQGPLTLDGSALELGAADGPFVLSIAPDGAVLWAHRLGQSTSGDQLDPRGLRVGAYQSGAVAVAGRFHGLIEGITAPAQGDEFVIMFGPGGDVQWTKSIAPATVGGLAISPNGDVLVAGTFEGTVDLGAGPMTSAGGKDVFFARLNASGTVLAAARAGGAGDDGALDVVVDESENATVVGYHGGVMRDPCPLPREEGCVAPPEPVAAPFLWHLDSQAGTAWTKEDVVGQGFHVAERAAVDPQGNIVVSRSDNRLEWLSPDGTVIWSKWIPPGTTVKTDSHGNVYLYGEFAGYEPPDFGGGYLPGEPGADMHYVAKLDSGGGHIFSESFATGYGGAPGGLVVDGSGGFSLLGAFMEQIDLGRGALYSEGALDLYIGGFAPHALDGHPLVNGQPYPGG